MKQKRNYSMTAKERKAMRAEKERKDEKPAPERAEIQTDEQSMAAAQTRSKRSTVIMIVVVSVAILLILAAILIPIIIYVVNPYNGNGKTMARFKLSNGMTLEYIIAEDEFDTAATNFIFLAKNGFFDNTVFYDAQNGWLRFGGYDAQPQSNSSSDYTRTHHRKNNEQYCKNFTALSNDKFSRVTYKFEYTLRADSGGTAESKLAIPGVLTFRYSNTATEFQFNYVLDNSETIDGLIDEIPCTMVGYPYDDKTVEKLKAIASTAAPNNDISSGYKWRPPTPDIKIESVKVYNLNGKKWNNFDFIKYMNEKDSSGSRRLNYWSGTV